MTYDTTSSTPRATASATTTPTPLPLTPLPGQTPAGGRIIVTAVDAREPRIWFVAWTCGCTDVARSPEALDPRCPGHDADAEPGAPVELTPGVSTNLGHLCVEPCTAESAGGRRLRESA